MELSYCVVNTNGRELLLTCLEAIRRTHPPGIEHEILVLDNASDDGSPQAVEQRFPEVRVIARDRRAGVAENNSLLLREARGRFCLLLNEDSEILEGAAEALLQALKADPKAAAAGAQLLDPNRQPIPCAWRFPGLGTALAQALFLHRWLVTQDAGTPPVRATRCARWAGCNPRPMLVRHKAAEQVGYLDPDFFVYSEEVDFQKRMRDAGWRILHVPAARAIHHEQLATDRSAGARRVVRVPPWPGDVHEKASLAAGGHGGPHPLGAGRTCRARSPPCSCPDTGPAGTGFTPARRFAPPGARECARRPRPTTRNSRRPGRLRRRPGPRPGAATS